MSKIFETLDNQIKKASVLLQFGLSSKALGDVEVLKTNDNPIGVTTAECRLGLTQVQEWQMTDNDLPIRVPQLKGKVEHPSGAGQYLLAQHLIQLLL